MIIAPTHSDGSAAGLGAPGGERVDRRLWRRKGDERVAAVEKIEDQRKPDDFFGHRNRAEVRVLLPQPTLETEKDIGSENPETTTVSGFFRAIFQGGIQKISFPEKDLWGGLEL